MAVRSNNYPSSEVKEIDLSTGAVVDSGSMHLVTGFTSKGQLFTPTKIYTLSQYVSTFGEPLTDAEFYVYRTVSNVIRGGGTPIVVRLPYDNIASKAYRGLAIKVGAGAGVASIGYVYDALTAGTDYTVGESATKGGIAIGSLYEKSGSTYSLTDDTTFQNGTTYYVKTPSSQQDRLLDAASLKGFTKFYPIDADVVQITNAQMASIAADGRFDVATDDAEIGSSVADYNFFVADRGKSTCIDEDNHGGFFVVVFDPLRAMLVQRLLDNNTSADLPMLTSGIDVVKGIYPFGSTDSIGSWSVDINGSVLEVRNGVKLFAPDSLSRQIANLFPGFDSSIVSDSVSVDKTYSNYIGIAVCMVTKSDSMVSTNTPTIVESFVGSIAPVKNLATGISEYIVDVVNSGSSYVSMYANRLNQTEAGQTSVSNGTMKQLPVTAGADALVYCGSTANATPSEVELTSFEYGSMNKVVNGATVGANLVKAFSKVADVDNVQVDVVVDAGLSSVAQFTSTTGGEYYQPDFDIDAANGKIKGASDVSVWTGVVNAIDSFCSGTRKDCMALIDAPRNATIKGSAPIINNLDSSTTFANDVQQGFTAVSSALNSSYSAMYANWVKVNNPYTGTDVWVPPSCEVAGACARCDITYNPWNSPAFLERGVLSGIAGLSLYPGKEEESFLYPKSINYVKYFNADGYVIWGQKTTQKKEGAFSRINVRRNALRIERHLYEIGRQFIGKGNTVYNRRQWIDLVMPYLSEIKNADGIYDFYLVCDETNNTPEVIDANEFRAAAFIKFVREGEFVLTSVVATNTGANFEEVVGVANA